MLNRKKHTNKKQYSGLADRISILKDNRGVSTSDIIITVVALIVIIVSVIFMIINISNLKTINQEIDELKTTIASKQEALNKLVELGNNEDLLKENYERNKLYIPSERDEVGINYDITSVIVDNDGTFRKLTFGEETTMENGIIDVLFVVRVECDFEQLDDIIDNIEKADRLYIIDSLVIVDSTTSTSPLSTDITIHAYYRND